jgi:hypothetical protein
MLYMTQTGESRQPRRLAWAQRPYEPIDNPVKRYLGRRSVGPGLWKRVSGRATGRGYFLRPAF